MMFVHFFLKYSEQKHCSWCMTEGMFSTAFFHEVIQGSNISHTNIHSISKTLIKVLMQFGLHSCSSMFSDVGIFWLSSHLLLCCSSSRFLLSVPLPGLLLRSSWLHCPSLHCMTGLGTSEHCLTFCSPSIVFVSLFLFVMSDFLLPLLSLTFVVPQNKLHSIFLFFLLHMEHCF